MESHIDGVYLFCAYKGQPPRPPSSHHLIKPGEFTPLAMLGPAVSPQCPSWLSVQERLPASQAQNRPGPLISARNAMNHSVEVMVQSAH